MIDALTHTEQDRIRLLDFSASILPLDQDRINEYINLKEASLNELCHYLLHNILNDYELPDELLERIEHDLKTKSASLGVKGTLRLKAAEYILKLYEHPTLHMI